MRAILMTLVLFAAAPALAVDAPDVSTENGRYAMTPAPDGFLRLDTRTGAVSLCTVASGAVACRASAEERRALEDEVDRLTQENARLKQAADPSHPASKYGIPNDQDVDRALSVAERFMKRMMKILRDDAAGDKG